MIVNEGLVYALNSSFGVPVGGAPAPIPQFYLALSTANRTWLASDNAATVHATASEFETYTEIGRPSWVIQALASISNIRVDDTGAEALFTIGDLSGSGGSVTVYGAFIISVSDKTGGADATATLLAGSNFDDPRVLYTGDKFNVGASLVAADGT